MTENQQKTILVVEDEEPLQNAITKKLGVEGFNVLQAKTVEEGITILKEAETIDAIWLDHYLLGKENGLDFVAMIKNDGEEWKHIPVFVVSNTATPKKMRTYIELGVNKYYVKSDHRLESIIGDIKETLEQGVSHDT